MTEPYTWGSMAKGIGDPTHIDDEIDSKLAAHNASDNAHGQSNEALYNHRVAELIDHLDESVENIKIKGAHRAYRAIVDVAGTGDYDNLQDAINYVNSIGGGNILIMSGTYTISADITMYSNIKLIGEDDEACIIDFNGTNKRVNIVGASDNYLRNIEINNLQFTGRRGDNTGAIYIEFAQDINIQNCYFTDNWNSNTSTGTDITIAGHYKITIQNNTFLNSGTAVYVSSSYTDLPEHINIIYNNIESALNHAIIFEACAFLKISYNRIYNIVGNGIHSTEDVSETDITYNYIVNPKYTAIYVHSFMQSNINGNILIAGANGDYGLHVANTGYGSNITNNIIYGFDLYGIDLNTGDHNNISSNIVFLNESRGIYLRSGSDSNIVIGNQVYDNTTAQITNSGANNIVDHNILTA